jgi:superfamily II DNA or RNA helicase
MSAEARDPRRLASESDRRRIFADQDGQCAMCGQDLDESFEVDHIVRHSDGGPTVLSNLRGLCDLCHDVAENEAPNRQNLRKWQQDALAQVLPILRDGKFATVNAAPGAGKTVFAAAATSSLLGSGLIERVVVFVPNLRLVGQWVDSAADRGLFLDPSPRYISERDGHAGAVYTYQALSNPETVDIIARDAERRPTLVILDEVHHLGRDEQGAHAAWSRAITSITGTFDYPNMPVLNLSGTLFRSNPTERIGTCNYVRRDANTVELVTDYDIATDQLITDGHLRNLVGVTLDADMEILDLRSGDVTASGVVDLDDSLAPGVKSQVIRQLMDDRDGFLVPSLERFLDVIRQQRNTLNGEPLKGLIICDTQRQAQLVHRTAVDHFADQFLGDIWKIATSDQGADAHREILEFQRNRDLSVLTSVRMVSEGFDQPRISAILYLSQVTAPLMLAQVAARAMRVTDAERDAGLRIPAYMMFPAIPALTEAVRTMMIGNMRLLNLPETCSGCGNAPEVCTCPRNNGTRQCPRCQMPRKYCVCPCAICGDSRYRCDCPRVRDDFLDVTVDGEARVDGYTANGAHVEGALVDLLGPALVDAGVPSVYAPLAASGLADKFATEDPMFMAEMTRATSRRRAERRADGIGGQS